MSLQKGNGLKGFVLTLTLGVQELTTRDMFFYRAGIILPMNLRGQLSANTKRRLNHLRLHGDTTTWQHLAKKVNTSKVAMFPESSSK